MSVDGLGFPHFYPVTLAENFPKCVWRLVLPILAPHTKFGWARWSGMASRTVYVHLVSFRLTAAYADLWILWPLSLKSPYLGLEAIFFRSRKFCWFFEHRSNFWELFSHLAANLGVLLVVRVEAISESLDLAVKSGGRETKKARVAPTTSQCRRKMKLGISTHLAKSLGKTALRTSPKISWTLICMHFLPHHEFCSLFLHLPGL